MEELMIEYLEDMIEVNADEALPRHVQEAGAIVRSGDAVVDKIQRDIAAGKDVDIAEALELDDSAMAFLTKKAPKKPDDEEPPEEFSDTYGEK